MKKKKIIANIGRFVQEKQDFFYVDKFGKVWSQEMIADLVESHKCFSKTVAFVKHYEKHLKE